MMQPDNNYAINKKNSNKFGQSQVPVGRGRVGQGGSQNLPLHYQRKSVTTTDRPPAVLVTGKKRIKRITLPYVPVLQDTNGGWYTINEIARRWDYDIEKINKGAVTGHEKSFSDVPPRPKQDADVQEGDGETTVGSSGGKLHYARKQILKNAYKFYAPAHLFQKRSDIESAVQTAAGGGPGELNLSGDCASVRGVAGGGRVSVPTPTTKPEADRGMVGLAGFGALEGFGDADFSNTSFLPMTECPWYVSELENIGIEIPKDSTSEGDREEYVLMPPVVRAQRMGQQFFQNFDLVKEAFEAAKEQTEEQLERTRDLKSELDERARNFASDLSRSELVFRATFSSQEARTKWLDLFGLTEVDIGKDVQKAAQFLGVQLNTVIKERMTESSWSTIHSLVDMAKAVADLDNKLTKLDEKLIRWESQFEIFKNVYQQRGGFKLKYNLPQAVLDDGIARVDPQTGILKSTEILAHVDKPVFFDGDESRVVDDGQVIVTFGYELQDPNIQAWTTFLFVPSDTSDEQPARPILAGVSRSTPIKAFVEPYDGRMYLMDAGTPVNLHEVYTQAKQRAATILGVPRVLVGFTSEYSGFHDFPLDAGVSGVQWIWGGAVARTHLSVNAPNARMPLGPNRLADMEPRRVPVPSIDTRTREQLEREAD